MQPRRELVIGLVVLVTGAGALLLAGSQTWLSTVARTSADFPQIEIALTGKDAAPLTQALGLVALAGLVAVLATRGIGRLVVGGVLLLSGLGATAAAGLFWSARTSLAVGAIQDRIGDPTRSIGPGQLSTTAWPLLGLAGAVLVVLAGAYVIWRGRTWPGMGKRYDSPVAVHGKPRGGDAAEGPYDAETAGGADGAADQADEVDRADEAVGGTGADPVASADLWKSLDRGEDPTR